MISSIKRKWQYLQYLYQSTGVTGAARHVWRKLIAPLYRYEAQYITVRNIAAPRPSIPAGQAKNGTGVECTISASPASLRTRESEIPAQIFAELSDRLEQGCIVILAWKPKKTGAGKDMAGYGICQRGVFSALGRKGQVSPDVLFSHYTEVFPEYRGQRIFQLLREAAFEYCRLHGLKKLCGVTSTYNQSAIAARTRTGEKAVGKVMRMSILGNLFVWETPWEKIEAALRTADEQAEGVKPPSIPAHAQQDTVVL